MPLSVPSDIAVDLRQPVVGDSFTWEAIEPGAAKKSIVIHATASQSPVEDGFTIADYHVNHNGWGGAGVHFCVTKDEYPGRANFTGPGSQVHYIGDLYTWRAGTANQNPGRIHIEISGLFTPGNGVPSETQLRKTKALIDHLLTQTPELPSLNFPSQVTYHNAVPDQQTECPGWQHPQFGEWFNYLKGGPEPSWWQVAPQVDNITPAPETPSPSDTTPGQGGVVEVVPEYKATYQPKAEQRPVSRPGANAVDVTTGRVVVENVPEGQVVDIAGYFSFHGQTYTRSVYSASKGLWNGVNVAYFEPVTGQSTGDIPISTPAVAIPAPNPTVLVDPTAVQSDVTDSQLQEATVPDRPKFNLVQWLLEVLASVTAKFIKQRKSS